MRKPDARDESTYPFESSIDLDSRVLEPLENPLGPKLLLM
jgi:hypothetical protein